MLSQVGQYLIEYRKPTFSKQRAPEQRTEQSRPDKSGSHAAKLQATGVEKRVRIVRHATIIGDEHMSANWSAGGAARSQRDAQRSITDRVVRQALDDPTDTDVDHGKNLSAVLLRDEPSSFAESAAALMEKGVK